MRIAKSTSYMPMQLQRILVAFALLFLLSESHAATIEVDSASGDSDSSSCTLKNAFFTANDRSVHGTCAIGTGDDLIILPANVTITLSSQDINAQALLQIVQSRILLVGNGSIIQPGLCALEIRVMQGGDLSIDGTTFQNACQSGPVGGSVINIENGDLRLTHDRFINNSSAGNDGGAISANFSSVEVIDSVFLYNQTPFMGGAIFSSNGTLAISDSYFAYNSASSGAAVSSADILSIVNSTFRENISQWAAVALAAGNSTGTISFSTFESNNASGVSLSGDQLVLANNIFSHGIGGVGGPNCLDFSDHGDISGVGQNLSDDYSCTDATIIPGRSFIDFGDLLVYDGDNAVLPLLVGSPAVGVGQCTDATGSPVFTDQRGVKREVPCDLGAFQSDGTPYTATPPAPLGVGNILVTVSNASREMDRTGAPVRTFYPSAYVGTYGLRDVAVDGRGVIGMYIGQPVPNLQLYDIAEDRWTSLTATGWGILNVTNDGKIAHVGDRWFLSASDEQGVGEDQVLAFDAMGFVGKINTCNPLHALAISTDSFLAIICDSSIEEYDSVSLQKLRTINTGNVAPGYATTMGAIDKSGNIILAEGNNHIYILSASGLVMKSTDCQIGSNTKGCFDVSSLSVSDDGYIFSASSNDVSSIIAIKTDFSTVASIPIGNSAGTDFFRVFALPGDEIFNGTFN